MSICGASPGGGTSSCANRGASATLLTEICMKCGVWLIGKPVERVLPDIYSPAFDLSNLSDEQRR